MLIAKWRSKRTHDQMPGNHDRSCYIGYPGHSSHPHFLHQRAGQILHQGYNPHVFSTPSFSVALVGVCNYTSRSDTGRPRPDMEWYVYPRLSKRTCLGRCHCGHTRLLVSRRKLNLYLAVERGRAFWVAKKAREVSS